MAEELIAWTKGKAAGHYNYLRSAFSVLRDPSFDDNAKARLRRIKDKTYKDGFFCSMLVTVCYQIGTRTRGCAFPPLKQIP